jgi:hypothetical protein
MERSRAGGRYVERAMEHDHEEARLVVGRGVVVDAVCLEVGVGTGVKQLPVGLHGSLEDDDCVRGGMAVAAGAQVGWIADEVVLGAR